jgi:hypothetical protein
LIEFAAKQFGADEKDIVVRDGRAEGPIKGGFSYKDLARNADGMKLFEKAIPSDVSLTPVKEWKVLGVPAARPNGNEIVTGGHKYPSDVMRPGMLYGKVLRAPAFGATLTALDTTAVAAESRQREGLNWRIGELPPSPDEVRSYLADARPDAYERRVDQLLASSHYGERWWRSCG